MPTVNESLSGAFRSKEEARISYNRMSKWYDLAASFERTFDRKCRHVIFDFLQ